MHAVTLPCISVMVMQKLCNACGYWMLSVQCNSPTSKVMCSIAIQIEAARDAAVQGAGRSICTVLRAKSLLSSLGMPAGSEDSQ